MKNIIPIVLIVMMLVAMFLAVGYNRAPQEVPQQKQDEVEEGIVPNAVTDYDGNSYDGVWVGKQLWMKENLRTKHYADGMEIPLGSSTSETTAYRYYPDNASSNVPTYGYLYNWKAVIRNNSSSNSNPSGVQGICPDGWHVPSDEEWVQLTNYVGTKRQYVCRDSYDISKALASITGWDISSSSCATGNDQHTNNATGFSALPAGYYYGDYYNFGRSANFWSATRGNGSYAFSRNIYYCFPRVYRYDNDEAGGYSVRCVRN